MLTWVCNNPKDSEWDSSRASVGKIGCETAVGTWTWRFPSMPFIANSVVLPTKNVRKGLQKETVKWQMAAQECTRSSVCLMPST